MIVENKPNYYIGTITYVESDPLGLLTKDKLYHEAVVSVPGVFESVLAFPARTNLDEPKVGDLVVVCSWDPVYNSYCTYEKLKENDFVGFRAHGKMVQINHEKVVVGVFDESTEYKDDDVPDVSPIAHLEMDKSGNITVHAAQNITVNGDADCTITIKGNNTVTINGNNTVKIDGNSSLEVGGNLEAKVSGNMEADVKGNMSVDVKGSTELSCPDVTVTGGQLTVSGTAAPTGQGGFNCLPACIFSGAVHNSHIVSGT
jgi:hypothetical protein